MVLLDSYMQVHMTANSPRAHHYWANMIVYKQREDQGIIFTGCSGDWCWKLSYTLLLLLLFFNFFSLLLSVRFYTACLHYKCIFCFIFIYLSLFLFRWKKSKFFWITKFLKIFAKIWRSRHGWKSRSIMI